MLITRNLNMIREACVEGLAQSLRAQELGADRIELCENLAVGGTTPSAGTIQICKKYLHIPIVVMIRPRGGDFIYTRREIEVMAHDIELCREAGADGIALGLLTPKNDIDMVNLQYLANLAGNMRITFHKAIDIASDIEEQFVRLLNSGLVHRLLTSGGAATAFEGVPVLNKLAKLSHDRISLVIAGKVTYENLSELSKLVVAKEFHGKKIVGDL